MDLSGQPPFMASLLPVATRSLTQNRPALSATRPLIVVNLCRMQGAESSNEWEVVKQRADGFWMNTAGTDSWPQIIEQFANKNAYYEITPFAINKKMVDLTVREVAKRGGNAAASCFYFGDENVPVQRWWREDTMDVAKYLTSNVTPCITALCSRNEWQVNGTDPANMGKEGPPRSDIGGGMHQASRCDGVCFEMSFEAWTNVETVRALRWCKANNKLFILLAHTDKADVIGAVKKAVGEMKAMQLWPDIIVPSNYGAGSIEGTDRRLPPVPEGVGADYPNTLTGMARYLIEAW